MDEFAATSDPFDHDGFILTVRHRLFASRVKAFDPEGHLLCSAVRSRRWLVFAVFWICAPGAVVGWPVGLFSLQTWLQNSHSTGLPVLLFFGLLFGGIPVVLLLARRFYPEMPVLLFKGDEADIRYANSWFTFKRIKTGRVRGETLSLVDRDGRHLATVDRSGRDGTCYSFWIGDDRRTRVRFEPERVSRHRGFGGKVLLSFEMLWSVLPFGITGVARDSTNASGTWFVVRPGGRYFTGTLAPRTSRKEYALNLLDDPSMRLNRFVMTAVAMLILVTPSNER